MACSTVKFTLLLPKEIDARCPVNKRFGAPQVQSARSGEDKNLLPLPPRELPFNF